MMLASLAARTLRERWWYVDVSWLTGFVVPYMAGEWWGWCSWPKGENIGFHLFTMISVGWPNSKPKEFRQQIPSKSLVVLVQIYILFYIFYLHAKELCGPYVQPNCWNLFGSSRSKNGFQMSCSCVPQIPFSNMFFFVLFFWICKFEWKTSWEKPITLTESDNQILVSLVSNLGILLWIKPPGAPDGPCRRTEFEGLERVRNVKLFVILWYMLCDMYVLIVFCRRRPL